MKKILLFILVFHQKNYAILPNIDPAPNQQTFPLHYHAYYGLNHHLEGLIEDGDFHIDSSDDLGRTPLHYAALCGKIHTVSKLIELGAEPYVKDKNGKIPAELALANGYITINRTLVTYRELDLAHNLALPTELDE